MPASFLDRFRDPSMGPATDDEQSDLAPISVSTLNMRARQLLEGEFKSIWVEGEISSLSQPRSGHAYFTLKDDKAQVRCALFRQRARFVSVPLREGQQVQLRAQVSLFEARGDYQLIVEMVKAAGKGALLAALEHLKERLATEGVFANQREIPYPPQHLAIITSPTGAAIQDIFSVLTARWPWIDVTLLPVQVQGEQAAVQMIRAIQLANRHNRFDAILITRGGGSFEDLWCFNDEALARAIHASHIPIVSAVGHETDTTLADFAADVRAPTPSAAAERLTPDQRDIRRRLAQLARRLLGAQQSLFDRHHQRVDYLSARLRHPGEYVAHQRARLDSLELRLMRTQQRRLDQERMRVNQLNERLARQSPLRRLAERRQHLHVLSQRLIRYSARELETQQRALTELQMRLKRSAQHYIDRAEQRLVTLVQRLDIASPLATLRRGYAVLEDEHKRIVRRASEVEPGQQLNARLGEGELRLKVLERKERDK